MTNISKLLLIIGCLVAIGSILYTQEIIGAYTFSTYRFYTDTVFVRILLFITSLIISASFYPAFADTIESRAKTDIAQGIACIIIGVVVSLFYMYEFNSIVLYALSIATPISIGIGMNILTKGKRLPNKYITLCILVIMLLAAYPFVTMNLFDTDEYSRRMGNLIYHGATGIYVIIASIIGSISMIYFTEKQKSKEKLFAPQEFISTLTKLSALKNADMLSEEEFNYQKNELIKSITNKKLNGDHLTFLAQLAELKQQTMLTNEDITNIKRVL
ncbi:hypothetical protein GKR57_14065 [Providencia stuartii]|uniref:hypothetical protein n=1 Tax=Providencia stuartii TaxID=588 RepID=UPI0012B60063|nr:hypothetical protein [Providencia stuartii]MTC20286.1 hypothetical protein [Providencia stuartii]